MTLVQRFAAMILGLAASLSLSAQEESKVEVIRGTQVSASIGTTVERQHGVVVMRPAPDSFLRETRRLETEARARDKSVPAAEAPLLVPVVIEKPYFPLIYDDYFYWTRWRRPPRPVPPPPAPPVRPHSDDQPTYKE